MQYKNILLLVIVSILSYTSLSAQEQNKRNRFDIEGFKKERANFIIENVKLTDAEAKAFIPLANELMDKRFELNRSVRKKTHVLKKKKDKTNADYGDLLDMSSDLKIKDAELEQEYLQKFKKVLSAEKIYKYKQAEDQYMKKTVEQRRARNSQKRK